MEKTLKTNVVPLSGSVKRLKKLVPLSKSPAYS